MEWERMIAAAIGIVGVIEWMKQPLKTAPGYVWWIAQGVLSIGVAVVMGGTIAGIVEHAMILLALTAIGYGSIVKLVQTVIENFRPKPTEQKP